MHVGRRGRAEPGYEVAWLTQTDIIDYLAYRPPVPWFAYKDQGMTERIEGDRAIQQQLNLWVADNDPDVVMHRGVSKIKKSKKRPLEEYFGMTYGHQSYTPLKNRQLRGCR